MTYEIVNADIIKWAQGHEWLIQNVDGPFHFIFGDWPYNLESILKRFGGKGAAPAKPGRDGAFQRQSAGFMGQTWDTGLAYQASTWRLLARLLHPGGFTASFSHARTAHRLATAQEAAGLLINPTLDTRIPNTPLAWLYATGKPNGTAVTGGLRRREHPLTEAWEGFQYGCPLAPEYEPLIIAQKPYGGSPVESMAATGAGGYNIQAAKQFQTNDRFPGTAPLIHHPGCVQRGYRAIRPNGTVKGIGGRQVHTYREMAGGRSYQPTVNEAGQEVAPDYDCHPDCQVAQVPGPDKAHYFTQIDWTWEILERLSQTNPYYYAAKVGAAERNAGCDHLPHVLRQRANRGGYANTPAWADTLQHNDHPTLKPIKLAQFIAALFLPPPEYAPRRVLVPTAGVGSEMIGCLLAGWDEVIGVELLPQQPGDPDYCGLAEARLAFFMDFIHCGQTDVEKILDSLNHAAEAGGDRQLSLLE